MFRFPFTAVLAVSLAFVSSFSALAGPGDLLVSPVRIVFEGRARVAEVTLVNKGDEPAVYRVSFTNRRMREDGSFEEISSEEAGERFAQDLVRYAPRRVELQPNAPQVLRLMLRKPAELENGEYRSHLRFAATPDASGASSIEVQNGSKDGISIKLTPVYGVTIPIIVRHGELAAAARIMNAQYSPTSSGGLVNFELQRDGERSLYGDFALFVAGEKEPVSQLRGIALYTPNQSRSLSMSLSPKDVASLRGKDIELRFTDRAENGDPIVASTPLAVR